MAPKTPAVAVQSKKKKEGLKKEVKPEAASETTTTTTKPVVEEPKPAASTAKKRGRKPNNYDDIEQLGVDPQEKKRLIKQRKMEESRALTDKCIQRIALKAGANRVNKSVYTAVRHVYDELLEDILYRAAILTIYAHRVVIKAKDVEESIKNKEKKHVGIYPNAADAEFLAEMTKKGGKGAKNIVNEEYDASADMHDDDDDDVSEDEEPTKKKSTKKSDKKDKKDKKEKKDKKKKSEEEEDVEMHDEETTEEPEEEAPEEEEEPEEKKKPAKKTDKKDDKKSEKTDKKSTKKKNSQ